MFKVRINVKNLLANNPKVRDSDAELIILYKKTYFNNSSREDFIRSVNPAWIVRRRADIQNKEHMYMPSDNAKKRREKYYIECTKEFGLFNRIANLFGIKF